MPDGDGVVNHISRVYIDGRALVRFELGIYSKIRHLKPSSPQKYYDFAKDFWNSQVILRTFEDRSELPLWRVFKPLAKHYEKATSPKHIRFSKSRSFNLCKVLLPQVQVIFETTDVDVLPPTSLRTNQDSNLYFGLSNLKMAGRGEKVPIVFLTHALHFKMLGDHPEFARLRSIRAHIAWLHADIELFLNLVLEGVKHPQLWDESSAFPDYLSEYANGFIEAIAKGDTLAPGLTSRYVAQLDPSRLERLRDAQQRLEKLKYPRSHEIVEKVNEFIRRCKRQSSHFQHFELD